MATNTSSYEAVKNIESQTIPTEKDAWASLYKDAFVQHQHDTSQLTLVLPDDCLILAGPPRISHITSSGGSTGTSGGDTVDSTVVTGLYPIGFINAFSVSETRQVQPLKGIGSRRHIFAATNSPIQIQIERAVIFGMNLLRSLYANSTVGKGITNYNSKFMGGSNGDDYKSGWFYNVEEDLYRIPFGLAIVYNSPANLAGGWNYSAGAEYAEVCTRKLRRISP